jgi:hypothetical protein
MDNSTKDSGYQDADMALGCGMELREIVMLDSGNSGKQMDLECIFGSMETAMKAISNNL